MIWRENKGGAASMAQDEKNNKLKFTVVQDEHFIDCYEVTFVNHQFR